MCAWMCVKHFYSLHLKDKWGLSILGCSGGRPDVSKCGIKVSSKIFPEIGRDACLLNQEGI